MRATAIWVALAAALLLPIAVAAGSPLLQWRSWVYIAGGFAGIVGLSLLVLQPLLILQRLPDLDRRLSRRLHRIVGTLLALAVILHVAGLWITSPPDVIDVLLLRSPTPFSLWGVVALWAVVAAAVVAASRRRLRYRIWSVLHLALAALAVVATVGHALLVEGAMGTLSKGAVCVLALVVTSWLLWVRRGRMRKRRNGV